MARVSQSTMATAPGRHRPADPSTDLNRLLDRLQQTVLRADAERERRLRTSEYERRRVESNIGYARDLLTTIEQEALTAKAQPRRQDALADLSRKREVLDQLLERMADLEEMASRAAGSHEEQNDGNDDSSEGEDILADIIATPSESIDSGSAAGGPTREEEHDRGEATVEELALPPPAADPSRSSGSDKKEQGFISADSPRQETSTGYGEPTAVATSQSLRPRTTATRHSTMDGAGRDDDTATASTTATATAAAAMPSSTSSLFGNRVTTGGPEQQAVKTATEAGQPTTAAAEAMLDLQRAQQDQLSASILKMAGDLKASSRAISLSLEEDRDVLGQAGRGMDRSERGLEAATRRMGALRRMTEGKGWWGRVLLYAWIYGLMVLLVLVVFVLPKLRF